MRVNYAQEHMLGHANPGLSGPGAGYKIKAASTLDAAEGMLGMRAPAGTDLPQRAAAVLKVSCPCMLRVLTLIAGHSLLTRQQQQGETGHAT